MSGRGIFIASISKIKTMPNKNTSHSHFIARLRSTPVLVLASVVLLAATLTQGFGVFAASCSSTSDCQQQIDNLSSQANQAQSSLTNLETQAGSYEATMGALQTQIDALQSQINANQAQQAQLQQQIATNQQKLTDQKATLANDLKTMYVSGQITPFEMLATSNNLSEYIDQQEAYSALQDKIQSTVAQITALQKQLQDQKTQVDQLLQAENSQNTQLSLDQSQQAQLLSYNESQQSQYNQQLASNQAQRTQLQAQLAILNTPSGSRLISGGVCGGGYPQSTENDLGAYWGCNHPQDNTIDNWGMDNRECVSYTAFRVHEEYLAGEIKHDMPNWGGVGDAYQWIDDARNAGIPVDQTPQAGDIAIRPASGVSGDVGHAMYVESVVNSSTIIVSQYNADYNGTYSMVSRSSAGLYFLHFSEWN